MADKIGATGAPAYMLEEREKEEILQRLAKSLSACQDLIFVYVHGSFLEPYPCHDVDLAIFFQPHLTKDRQLDLCLQLAAELSYQLHLPVDVHSLNHAAPPFAHEVVRRGKLLLCRDRLKHSDFLERVSAVYRDFLPLLELIYADLLAL